MAEDLGPAGPTQTDRHVDGETVQQGTQPDGVTVGVHRAEPAPRDARGEQRHQAPARDASFLLWGAVGGAAYVLATRRTRETPAPAAPVRALEDERV